jgi:DNA-binding CsgD family transcriptional regulator
MGHLIVLTLVLNLIAGMAVFIYALSAYRRFRLPFFKTLLAYVVSFNGLVIVYFVYTYVLTNVFGSDQREIYTHPMLFSVLLVLVYGAEFGMAVNLFRLMKHLQGQGMSGRAKGLFALWLTVFVALSAYGLIFFFRETRWLLFYWIHAAWMFSLALLILSMQITVLISSRKSGPDRNALRPLAWMFLAGYALFAFSHLDYYFIHTGFQKFYDPFLLLVINLCPLLWLRFFFEKGDRVVAPGDIEGKLARFCESFGISKREREIIAQVMLGKTNKDIERILFISHNTVKNHLYSVYQKAGVKSRSELIHRINLASSFLGPGYDG